MKKKLAKKTRPTTVTIRMDNTDFLRLDWLRTFLGGGNASSALKFALKAAYEQQRALQRAPVSNILPGVPMLRPNAGYDTQFHDSQAGNLAGGSQKDQNRG
jgi:hypothetical protein